MATVRGAHGGEWGEFFHRGGAMTPGTTERLMAAYLTWRGIPLQSSLQPLAQRAQQPHVPPPQQGTYGNAAVARMMGRGTRLDGSSSSSRRTATITTPLAPIPCQDSDCGHKRTHPSTVGRNVLHVLRPIHLRAPHTRRHTKPTARRRRHADYGRSSTIEGRHATEFPARACVQTGGTTTPTTTPRGHRDAGTPGVTCREQSRTQPREYGSSGHPARTTPWHRTPAQGANPEPHRKPENSNTPQRVRTRSPAGSQPGSNNTGPPGAPPAAWHT